MQIDAEKRTNEMDNILGIPVIPPSSPLQQRYFEGIDMSRSGWLGFFQYRI